MSTAGSIDAPERRERKSSAEWKKTDRLKVIREKESDFLTKAELAHHLGCHINTINRWIRQGTVPPPHSRPGGKHPMWLRKHYEAYKRAREWPPEAFWNRANRG